MHAKTRYRLRQKLQAVLLRVYEVVKELQEAGVDCNSENAATVETVLHILMEFRNSSDKSAKDDDPEKVVALAAQALANAGKRRKRETGKRKIRNRRRGKR